MSVLVSLRVLIVFSLLGVFEAFFVFSAFWGFVSLGSSEFLDWVFCFLSAFLRALTLSWELLLYILEKLLSTLQYKFILPQEEVFEIHTFIRS